MKFLLCWSKEETRKINLQEESPCLDVRFPAPQTEDTLDCALLERDLAYNMLAALREWDLPELAAEIAPDWDLPTEAVQSGLETLRSHLELVRGDVALLYEML